MEQRVYSVFDIKGKCYTKPFFMVHNGEALRLFGDAVNDEKTTLNKHPEDYQLFLIGTFDDNSGQLKSKSNPEFLSNAVDFVKEK